jgi:ATP-binding cassette subfamily C protein
MTDHFKAIFKTDLDRNLNFTEETIEIFDDKISVYDDNKNKILENDNLYQIILKDLDKRSLKELNKII